MNTDLAIFAYGFLVWITVLCACAFLVVDRYWVPFKSARARKRREAAAARRAETRRAQLQDG